METYLFLLSDMLLITYEREGKYVVKDSKEHLAAIPLHTISNIHAEITRKHSFLMFLSDLNHAHSGSYLHSTFTRAHYACVGNWREGG